MKDTFKRLNWPNIIIAISLIAIGIGIYLVFHKRPDDTPSKPIGSSTQQKKADDTNESKKQEQKQPAKTQPAPAPAKTSTPAPTASGSTTQPRTLANSGPGETAALFTATAIAGAALHQVLIRRRVAFNK